MKQFNNVLNQNGMSIKSDQDGLATYKLDSKKENQVQNTKIESMSETIKKLTSKVAKDINDIRILMQSSLLSQFLRDFGSAIGLAILLFYFINLMIYEVQEISFKAYIIQNNFKVKYDVGICTYICPR